MSGTGAGKPGKPGFFEGCSAPCIPNAELRTFFDKEENTQMTRQELEDENDKLKRLVRFMYLTLGYYGTLYNYDDGKYMGGVLQDRGHDARQANLIAKRDFSAEVICSWPSPKEGVFNTTWDEAKEKKEEKNG